MIEELKPREQKAYVRGKMQEVSTENNTTIVLSSDTEMEEEEEPVKDRKRRNTKSEEKVEEEDGKAGEKTFGTPISLSRKSSSGSRRRAEGRGCSKARAKAQVLSRGRPV